MIDKQNYFTVIQQRNVAEQQLDQLKAENDKLRETMHKDRCTHYVLGECSQEHHNNCVGRNQCIKDLEQENERLKVYKSITPLKVKMLVKTLAEIKDCFGNYKKEQDYLSFVSELNQILQKISEVLK